MGLEIPPTKNKSDDEPRELSLHFLVFRIFKAVVPLGHLSLNGN